MQHSDPLFDFRVGRTLSIALAIVVGSCWSPGHLSGQAPPLAGLFQPPPDSVATTLFCPDCLVRPFLFEAHLQGKPVAPLKNPATGEIVEGIDVDVDLLVFRPGTTRISNWSQDCTQPPAPVVSNEMQACYEDEKFALTEISPTSTGWYDHYSQGSGYYERESFFVGNRADVGLDAGARWCLLPFVQQASRGGLVATVEMGIAFGADPLRVCTAEVVAEAKGVSHSTVVAEGCDDNSTLALRRPAPLIVEWLANGTACLHIPASWTCSPETPRCAK